MEERLDKIIVAQGLCASRTQAQHLIQSGLVKVEQGGRWELVKKPSAKFSPSVRIQTEDSEEHRYVSRAGLKLEAAIEAWGGDLCGKKVLDIGQSTGGFTDCLLKKGAEAVVGVEVGHDQLAATLRSDPRVTCLEGVNARHSLVEHVGVYAPAGFDVVVMDVSFISQTLILPNIPPVLVSGGVLMSLVKPQFEVGKEGLGKGGIVKDQSLYGEVQSQLLSLVKSLGLSVLDYIESPIQGGDGNREFLLIAKK